MTVVVVDGRQPVVLPQAVRLVDGRWRRRRVDLLVDVAVPTGHVGEVSVRLAGRLHV